MGVAELMGKILNPLGDSYAVYLLGLGEMGWANWTQHWLAEWVGVAEFTGNNLDTLVVPYTVCLWGPGELDWASCTYHWLAE